eukprot:scaffold5612_cov46-Attheya_sp.AAC.4
MMMMLSQWTRCMAVILTLCSSVSLVNASVRGTISTRVVESSPEEDAFLSYGNVAWADLPLNVKDAWDDLGFGGGISWTVQGMNEEREEDTWSDLDEEDRALAEIVGFTGDSWDCLWEKDEDAAIVGKAWGEIEAEVQAALEGIFWTRDLWDNYGTENNYGSFAWTHMDKYVHDAWKSIGVTNDWKSWWQQGMSDDTSTIVESSPEEDGTPEEDASSPKEGAFLYYGNVAWDDLPLNIKDAWQAIGFTNASKSWWQQGRDYDAIESKSWSTLDIENSFFQGNATIVGFTNETWDCHINHYYDYSWEELIAYDLNEYFETIGYTASDMWEGDDETDLDFEDKEWDEIETEVQGALVSICWTEDLWDDYKK